MARPDHYATLGVARTATDAEIKAAFRQLARQFHPDVHGNLPAAPGDPDADRRFKAIARAYETLGRPSRRRAYDTRRARGRFGDPGSEGPTSYRVDHGPIYHSDLGHHSDFYQAGDPLTVREAAAIVRRHPDWLRRAIRTGRLAASRSAEGYLVRRRDVERLDRSVPRRPRGAGDEVADAAAGPGSDGPAPEEAE
ncbi:MAG TPA: J domain-containing protein [Candidatus Limnocylindrales bacterium]